MDLGLKNRNVIVAASSDGIARSAAEKFAAEGANVAMCSRDAGKLKIEGKEYVVKDGDVLLFRFNV